MIAAPVFPADIQHWVLHAIGVVWWLPWLVMTTWSPGRLIGQDGLLDEHHGLYAGFHIAIMTNRQARRRVTTW
jgi:hypothetical protein